MEHTRDFKPIHFVEYIRKQKCVVCFKKNVDPDHLISIGMGRNRNNEDLLEHLSCVPLCRKHHMERHSTTINRFESKYNINLFRENHEYLMDYFKKLSD